MCGRDLADLYDSAPLNGPAVVPSSSDRAPIPLSGRPILGRLQSRTRVSRAPRVPVQLDETQTRYLFGDR